MRAKSSIFGLFFLCACSAEDVQTSGPDTAGKADAPSGLSGFTCDWDAGPRSGDSQLITCNFDEAPLYVLKLKGSYEEISFDHGKLLARQIDDGVLREIRNVIDQNLDQGCAADDRLCRLKQGAIHALYECWMGRMDRHTSDEFAAGTRAFARGYREGFEELTGRPSQFSEAEVIEAALSIEFYNAVDGLLHEVSFPHAIAGALAGIASVCAIQSVVSALDDDVTVGEVKQRMEDTDAFPNDIAELGAPGKSFEFGCTGLTVPGAETTNGAQLHARNLDADMVSSWNKAPVLFLIDETEEAPADATWFKYVAAGSAGLNFPGGISGLNEAGISVSLHQMSTTEYETGFFAGDGEIAPYLEQRILREASSIDEAIALARDTLRFAAWTIFISDAKTGESARIEFNGDDIEVSPENWKGQVTSKGQSNHFLHPDMAETDFDLGDEHFTHNFNKYLETRSRLNWVNDRLAADAGSIGVRWAVDMLSGHHDFFAGEQRAFGRTPVKAYGIMSTVTEANPDEGLYRFWLTLGERLPASHSHYLGFDVNWDDFSLGEVGALRTQQYDHIPGWVESLQLYVRARQAYVAHDIDRHMTEADERDAAREAEALLTQAIEQAERDGIVEVPYHFLRARVRHELGEFAAASDDWTLLKTLNLTSYQRALVLMYSVATADADAPDALAPGREEELKRAEDLLISTQQLFAPHHDLELKLELLDQLRESPQDVTLPSPDFVTIE